VIKLNEKVEVFCHEYMVDYNASKAAHRAGYSAKTAYSQGNRLLKNVEVLSRVRELQIEKTKRLAISQDWVVHQLVDVIEKCIKPVPVMQWDYEEREMRQTGEYTFDSKGATKALELLGKHLGMYVDKVELKTEGVTIVNDIPEGSGEHDEQSQS
jgi:phage terminase small subunit